MRITKLRGFAVAPLLLALAACEEGTPGSGKLAAEHRTVAAAFTSIEASGSLDLEVKDGPVNVDVDGDDNLVPLLETTVDGGTLKIRPKTPVRTKLPMHVKVTAPGIDHIEASGAVDVDVHGAREKLAIRLSGAGNITGEGKADQLDIVISGAGNADLTKIVTKSARARISGAGSVELAEPDTLDADISGAGRVTYGGSPKVDKHVSGAGSISHR